MLMLTATRAFLVGIKRVIIKAVNDATGEVIVVDPHNGVEFILYQSPRTVRAIGDFARRHHYTENRQLVGAVLIPEPVSPAHKHVCFWRAELPIT